MRITSDISGLERVAGPGVAVHVFSRDDYPRAAMRRVRLLISALASDHLVVHFSLRDVMLFASVLTIAPFHRCRLTTLDFFVGDLTSTRRAVLRWGLRGVDRFVVYFNDTRAFERLLGLPASRFRYIPFKINAREVIAATRPTDAGYLFCGGRSRRDFRTFFAAVAPLGMPVKVVTSSEADIKRHGSSLSGLSVPPNVEITTRDHSPEFFVRTMAAARLVVIPLLADSTTQAGIAVCLQAMALRKCVVISAGLGVRDVLTDDEAVIVPPGDHEALRAAIASLWDDAALRDRYAAAAVAYAARLGGDDDLRRALLDALAS